MPRMLTSKARYGAVAVLLTLAGCGSSSSGGGASVALADFGAEYAKGRR
jgi:hypothetical protein